MKNSTRIILQVIGVPLALISGFLAIMCFIYGVLDGEENSFGIFLLFLLLSVTGVFCVLLTYSMRLENDLRKSFIGVAISQLENALRKSIFADALRLGGKQMLCDIIK